MHANPRSLGGVEFGDEETQAIQSALDEVLSSRTFRRSDQLRKFLKFICEMELSGRRAEIDEYSVAVQALGRPADFSSESDSSVRTRAHSLRQKLDEYYASEAPGAPVRLELPKGSYIPVFRFATPALPVIEIHREKTDSSAGAREITGSVHPVRWRWFAAGAAAFLAVVGAFLWIALRERWLTLGPRLQTPAALQEVWGPLLDPDLPTVICVGQPAQVWVRTYDRTTPIQYPPLVEVPPAQKALYDFYEENSGHRPFGNLYLHPSPNAPLWGDVSGAALAGRFLAQNGVRAEFLPERTVRGSYAIRGRNALIFGRPEYSPLVASALSRGFTVTYLPDVRRYAIVSQIDASQRYFNSDQTDLNNYGLITVLHDANAGRRTIVFSGITSDGSQAGVEFLTAADKVEKLKERLRASGVATWPDAFQVVVRTYSSLGYPVRVDYETHLVLR